MAIAELVQTGWKMTLGGLVPKVATARVQRRRLDEPGPEPTDRCSRCSHALADKNWTRQPAANSSDRLLPRVTLRADGHSIILASPSKPKRHPPQFVLSLSTELSIQNRIEQESNTVVVKVGRVLSDQCGRGKVGGWRGFQWSRGMALACRSERLQGL